ncbi:MAG: VPLPA-CTERM sorting domain-containing protein [Chitinophagaceae bacterium]|nr:VPLPA-CTERM sorting domain-containing protein [Rubrivivax sp.]
MKLEIKMIAIAAALASLAGGAQAAVSTVNTNNGSFALTVFNPVNKAWYIRDLGFTINTFLPTGTSASYGDPTSTLVGDKTPQGGLTLNAGNTPNFAGDANWNTWFAAQTANASELRWHVAAGDTLSGGPNGGQRMLTSSANPDETVSNGQVGNFTGASSYGSIQGFLTEDVVSQFDIDGVNAPYQTSNNTLFGLGADGLASIGQGVGLFYFARVLVNTPGGLTGNPALGGAFSNSGGRATLSLASNGNLSYTLEAGGAAPIPLPAAVWLMGAGLVAMGTIGRRRKNS